MIPGGSQESAGGKNKVVPNEIIKGNELLNIFTFDQYNLNLR